MEERIHFVKHQEKPIMVVDCTGATATEMQLTLEHVRMMVARHARESILILADMTGATFDHAVATKMKEVLTLDRPFVKKAAWVGADKVPKAFMENFHTFSQRDIVTFQTREEAMDWLVKD